MRMWGGIWAAGACTIVAIVGCDREATAEAPIQQVDAVEAHTGDAERVTASTQPRKETDQEGLLIGEYRLADKPVVDGDTVRVEGVDGSIRLLSIDTEEKLRSKADRAAAARDFELYLKGKRGDAVRPRKAGTPIGEEASEFAKAFFEGADVVRLERDDPRKIRGHYGRLLAYAFLKKNGRWTSYNVECVRAGMSPYFTKYGYSHRFHNQLSHAEAEARAEKRGIWDPSAQGYGDYDERKAWWNARADFIRAFEHEANRRDDYIQLTHWDALAELEERLGQEVTILATVDQIRHFKGLVRVSLARQRGSGFPVIFFDKDAFRESGIDRYKREPVSIRGTVERYEKGNYRTLQIVVKEPAQVMLAKLPWPSDAKRAAE
ncbi:MAG: thermonuclease family protein [Deltaproteobacteria bacterium]|nr:thermonuclease family protein [Deltaproteobacteria bacterium]